jgi:hypothetical protein
VHTYPSIMRRIASDRSRSVFCGFAKSIVITRVDESEGMEKTWDIGERDLPR